MSTRPSVSMLDIVTHDLRSLTRQAAAERRAGAAGPVRDLAGLKHWLRLHPSPATEELLRQVRAAETVSARVPVANRHVLLAAGRYSGIGIAAAASAVIHHFAAVPAARTLPHRTRQPVSARVSRAVLGLMEDSSQPHPLTATDMLTLALEQVTCSSARSADQGLALQRLGDMHSRWRNSQACAALNAYAAAAELDAPVCQELLEMIAALECGLRM